MNHTAPQVRGDTARLKPGGAGRDREPSSGSEARKNLVGHDAFKITT
jgi:hypothetical protein